MTADPNIITLDIDGAVYHVRRRTTGADYLRLQEAVGTEEKIDTRKYTHTAMQIRCRELDALSHDDIVALPRPAYQALSRLCTDLEREESEIAEGFLPNGSLDSAELESTTPLTGSSKRTRDSSERST